MSKGRLPYWITGLCLLICLGLNSCKKEIIDADQIIFTKFLGGLQPDEASTLLPAADGGFYIFGSSRSFSGGGWDMLLIHTDEDGNELWTRNYGTIEDEKGLAMIALPNGDLLLGGSALGSDGDLDGQLIRATAEGNVIWSRNYGTAQSDEQITALFATNDGGMALGGDMVNAANGQGDFQLTKLDANGNVEWLNSYGRAEGEERATSMFQDAGDNYYLYGSSTLLAQTNMFLVNTDELGNELWFNEYGGLGDEFAGTMSVADQGLFLSGTFLANGIPSARLIKVDALGTVIFTYDDIPGSAGQVAATSTAQLPLLAGTQIVGNSNRNDLFLQFLDAQGNSTGSRFSWGGEDSIDRVVCVLNPQPNEFEILGTTEFDGNSMLWFLKIDLDN